MVMLGKAAAGSEAVGVGKEAVQAEGRAVAMVGG